MVAENAKVVLVTGASRGLGRSIALELGSQGHKIIVNYAGSKDAADKTVEDIKAAGGDAVAIQANCKYHTYRNPYMEMMFQNYDYHYL